MPRRTSPRRIGRTVVSAWLVCVSLSGGLDAAQPTDETAAADVPQRRQSASQPIIDAMRAAKQAVAAGQADVATTRYADLITLLEPAAAVHSDAPPAGVLPAEQEVAVRLIAADHFCNAAEYADHFRAARVIVTGQLVADSPQRDLAIRSMLKAGYASLQVARTEDSMRAYGLVIDHAAEPYLTTARLGMAYALLQHSRTDPSDPSSTRHAAAALIDFAIRYPDHADAIGTAEHAVTLLDELSEGDQGQTFLADFAESRRDVTDLWPLIDQAARAWTERHRPSPAASPLGRWILKRSPAELDRSAPQRGIATLAVWQSVLDPDASEPHDAAAAEGPTAAWHDRFLEIDDGTGLKTLLDHFTRRQQADLCERWCGRVLSRLADPGVSARCKQVVCQTLAARDQWSMIRLAAATIQPTSLWSSSDAPSSDAPSSDAPSSDAPSSDAPSSDAPSSDAPSSDAPSSDAPSSDATSSDTTSIATGATRPDAADPTRSAVDTDDTDTAGMITARLIAESFTRSGDQATAYRWWSAIVDIAGAGDFATRLRCAETATAVADVDVALQRLREARQAAGDAKDRAALLHLIEADIAIQRLQFDHARGLLETVVRNPEATQGLRGRAQWMIGETYYMQQQFDQAIQAYRLVEGIDPTPAWVAASLLQAGKSFEQLGRTREATVCYGHLVQRFADSGHAETARTRLANLPGGPEPSSATQRR